MAQPMKDKKGNYPEETKERDIQKECECQLSWVKDESMSVETLKDKNGKMEMGTVAHTYCNPSYLRGRDQKDCDSQPAPVKR
jgi:hypothetical protein